MADIVFSRRDMRAASESGKATVYTRATMGDAWTELPNVHAQRVTWSVAPTMSSADLVIPYGVGLAPTGAAFSAVTLTELLGQYIQIRVAVDGTATAPLPATALTWDGIALTQHDQPAGFVTHDGTPVATGEATVHCLGLEYLLDYFTITKSEFWDDLNGNDYKDAARGLTFNADASGRRVANKDDGGPFFTWTKTQIEKKDQQERNWSTKDIVYHVVNFMAEGVTIEQKFAEELPDWDRPIVRTHGRTPWAVLNQVLSRQRGLTFKTILSTEGLGSIAVVPYSFNSEDVHVGPSAVLSANESTKSISLEDPLVTKAITTDIADQFERVIVSGARRRSCFSISDEDGTLVAGWPGGGGADTLEDEYNKGATGAPDYPTSDFEKAERRRMDQEVRSSPRLRDVFSLFALHQTGWNVDAGDGKGGTKTPVAPDDDHPATGVPIYQGDLEFLRTLPLLEGNDYSGTKIAAGTVALAGDPFGRRQPGDEIPPLVFFHPAELDPGKYVMIDQLGAAANQLDSKLGRTGTSNTARRVGYRKWSGRVTVEKGWPPRLRITVTGAPQHAIASSAFSNKDDAQDTGYVGDNDWEQYGSTSETSMVCTVAIEEDRHVVKIYPDLEDEERVTFKDLHIDAGREFRLDYVLAGTCVGIDTGGELERVTTAGFVRDDRERLGQLARIAYEWYGVERKALTLVIPWVTGPLERGMIITEIEQGTGSDGAALPTIADVNSMITSIEYRAPRASGPQIAPPVMTYKTAFAELDPSRIL